MLCPTLGPHHFEVVVDLLDAGNAADGFLRHLLLKIGLHLALQNDATAVGFKAERAPADKGVGLDGLVDAEGERLLGGGHFIRSCVRLSSRSGLRDRSAIQGSIRDFAVLRSPYFIERGNAWNSGLSLEISGIWGKLSGCRDNADGKAAVATLA